MALRLYNIKMQAQCLYCKRYSNKYHYWLKYTLDQLDLLLYRRCPVCNGPMKVIMIKGEVGE